MSADIIVSYDGTPNDDDALALGKALCAGGASLALAYVRHSVEFDAKREELAQHDAQRRLDMGIQLVGEDLPTHIVLNPSTTAGLEQLAASEGASIIVFASDYRTPPGRAEPGSTAARMLEGGAVAIAVAAAGRRAYVGQPITAITVAPGSPGEAQTTAESLVSTLTASLVGYGTPADLIVVGSPNPPSGRVNLTGATRNELNQAGGSVLVLANATSVAL